MPVSTAVASHSVRTISSAISILDTRQPIAPGRIASQDAAAGSASVDLAFTEVEGGAQI